MSHRELEKGGIVAPDRASVATIPVHPRLRIIETSSELAACPITADELIERAVIVKASARPAATTAESMESILPWLSVWYDHEYWRTGAWTCRVTSEGEFTGEMVPLLKFHTDMSRRPEPPAYTVIRSIAGDPQGGGASLLVHIDDAIRRLEELGEDALLRLLRTPRTLNVADGTKPTLPLLSHRGHTRVRIFDYHIATKGLHFDMSDHELRELDRFIDACHTWSDLIMQADLQAGDLIAFSNHTFLHGRTACLGTGRVTDIVLGNCADNGRNAGTHPE
jgi:alpha-ketoglutarate-dependent taurine dioxygenase